MAPIVVQTDKPINSAAAKPDGTTPQTAQDSSSNRYAPPTQTLSSDASSYRQAQPGAPAFPAPTGAITSPPSQYPQPTPTETTPSYSVDSPPPPQPGAVPTIPQPQQPSTQTLPPPPRVGEYIPQQRQPPQPQPTPTATASASQMPPQFSQPPPATNQAPTYSTYAPPQLADNTTYSVKPQAPPEPAFQHPPGYQQNPDADKLTAAQRAAAQQENATNGSILPNLSSGGGGLGVGMEQTGVSGAWDSAKKWMGDVAGKVGELEGEVWKRVNNEK